MRLAEFISDNTEAILTEWEAFATTLLPAASDLSSLALRDHAPQILAAIVKDIATAQTREQQAEKSKGRAPREVGAPETAAQTHAVLRARTGFDIEQLVAEYRALRASVLRLWLDSEPAGGPGVEDLMRFNEAIDQAIAESVGHFHLEVEQSRNLFLGMLGHDMRTPLNAIVATAGYLAALNAGGQVSAAAERLIRSGGSMRALLDDLVDFNRSQLGLGINIAPTDIDLKEELADELEQLRRAHADRPLELNVAGDVTGRWDSRRLKQVLRNLVSNAIEYGYRDAPVRVTLAGAGSEVRLEVANHGPCIDPSVQAQLFNPLRRGLTPDAAREHPDGLGLGLFIVRAIVTAHGGNVEVRSSGEQGGTTFAVMLPRRTASVAAESAAADAPRLHSPDSRPSLTTEP
jgi:signal transduction histidine kinase